MKTILQDKYNITRRCRTDLYNHAEKAIADAVQAVESLGAHTSLTNAVVLLSQAKNEVSDYVDLQLSKFTER